MFRFVSQINLGALFFFPSRVLNQGAIDVKSGQAYKS